MPPDQNQQHPRRPHYHRGRRGPDRRGGDRRPQQQQQQQTENTSNRDQLDVEQIMREVRSRISEKHGIDLTAQQIQELAARRLEAILDPRAIKPSLMDELRRAAGLPADTAPSEPEADEAIAESALYASGSGFLNSIRRFFSLLSPKAIADALNTQSRKTKALATREAELRRRQTEWNALHFEILRRLVTDVARVEIDNQHLAHRVESLQARVDFNERRVRSLEQSQQQQSQHQHQPRPATRPSEAPIVSAVPASPRSDETPSTDHTPPSPDTSPEGSRRRRRRRRGRRSGQPRDITGAPAPGLAVPGALDQSDQGPEGDDFGEEDAGSDDIGDDITAAPMESAALLVSPEPLESSEPIASSEPLVSAEPIASAEPVAAPFEPPPSVPEEPVHVAPSVLEDVPVAPEAGSTPDPIASAEGSDPLTREQS
jgi:hypothetical protein